MNKTAKYLRVFLKGLVSLLAVGNLVFLFLFDYQVPGFLKFSFGSSHSAVIETEQTETETEAGPLVRLNVPSQALTYDGTSKLDLMDGVTVTDASGAETEDLTVFSSIKAGSSGKEKIIEYSVTDSEGNRVTAERTLNLGSDYTGPTIELLGDMPDVAEDELSTLVSQLIDGSLIKADDGFGKDVTSAVTSSVKSETDESGDCVVTLTITNLVNDSYSTDVTIHTQLSGPVIRLTTSEVTLNVGESFSFYQYIAAAEDENGNSLFEHISMNGSVDTSTAGTYVLEFYCVDNSGNKSPVKQLTVIVK